MYTYENHLEKCLSYIAENQSLIDCHLVDFITENLWEKCLTLEFRSQLESLEEKNFNIEEIFYGNIDDEIDEFIRRTNILNLKNNPNVLQVDEMSTFLSHVNFTWNNEENNCKLHDNFMKEKKRYEISVLTKVIGYLIKTDSNLVIDVGAGKGYLATSLSEKYGIPVLAIDSCESRHNSAILRQKLIKKKKHQSFPLVKHHVKHIDDTTDYSSLVRSLFPNYNSNDNLVLAGLHACGPLSHAMIKSFLNSSCVKSLCVVSCCYHLNDKSLTKRCTLTKNARMLAQQSVERTSIKNKLPSLSLFYRALLQVLLKSLGMDGMKIGKGAPMKSFEEYVEWSLTKIGIEPEKIPSKQQLKQLYDKYIDKHWKMNLFQLLRIHAGSVVEAAIILDQVIYLQNNEKCKQVALVKLFDSLLSPRCYAIIALK